MTEPFARWQAEEAQLQQATQGGMSTQQAHEGTQDHSCSICKGLAHLLWVMGLSAKWDLGNSILLHGSSELYHCPASPQNSEHASQLLPYRASLEQLCLSSMQVFLRCDNLRLMTAHQLVESPRIHGLLQTRVTWVSRTLFKAGATAITKCHTQLTVLGACICLHARADSALIQQHQEDVCDTL